MTKYVSIILVCLALQACTDAAFATISICPFAQATFSSGASNFGTTIAVTHLPHLEPYVGIAFHWNNFYGVRYYFGVIGGTYIMLYNYNYKGIKPHADLSITFELPAKKIYPTYRSIYVNIGGGIHLDFLPRITPVLSGGLSINFSKVGDADYTVKKTNYYGYFNYTLQINL
jgi:hypothetical protein